MRASAKMSVMVYSVAIIAGSGRSEEQGARDSGENVEEAEH